MPKLGNLNSKLSFIFAYTQVLTSFQNIDKMGQCKQKNNFSQDCTNYYKYTKQYKICHKKKYPCMSIAYLSVSIYK